MTHSRMTPRRWFWTLMLGVAFWMVIGSRFFAPTAKSSGNQAAETGDGLHGWLRDNAKTVLLPASATLRWGQAKFEKLGTEVSSSDAPTLETVQALRQENNLLTQQRNYALEQIEQYKIQLAQLNRMRSFPSLLEQQWVYANIRGFGSGPGDTITIDRGSADGVRPGLIVMSQLSVLGRVISAGAKVSTVRLMTDPSRAMWINARLVRRSANVEKTIAELCEVHGIGEGLLRCESIEATRGMMPPEKGDVLLVDDNGWAVARGTELGRVLEVGRLENQNLRYDLKIQPLANVAETSQVGVILTPQ